MKEITATTENQKTPLLLRAQGEKYPLKSVKRKRASLLTLKGYKLAPFKLGDYSPVLADEKGFLLKRYIFLHIYLLIFALIVFC